MGMGATCAYAGERTTAAAYLQGAPSNLTLALNSPVAKVLMQGNKATGIQTIAGQEFRAKKDVILSGGVRSEMRLTVAVAPSCLSPFPPPRLDLVQDVEIEGDADDHCA